MIVFDVAKSALTQIILDTKRFAKRIINAILFDK